MSNSTTSNSTATWVAEWTTSDTNAVKTLTVIDWLITSFFLASLIYRFERGRRMWLFIAAAACEQVVWANFASNPKDWIASDVFAFLGVRLLVGWYGYLKTLDILNDLIKKGSMQKIRRTLMYVSFAIYTISEVLFTAFLSLFASVGFIVALSIYVHIVIQIRKYPNMPVTLERMHGVAGARIALSVISIVVYALVYADAKQAGVYIRNHVGLVLVVLMYNIVLKWMTITGTGYTVWDMCCSKGDTKFEFATELEGDPQTNPGDNKTKKPDQQYDNPYDI
jgi:hypothetical protein